MRYQEARPSAATARFVQCYWLLEDSGPGSGIQRVVPDGRSELIVNLGRPYEVQVDGLWRPQPQSFFFGQITGPLFLRPAGPLRMIGIRFHPHTAGRFLKLAMSELTDTAISLADISGAMPRAFDELAEARSPVELFTAVDRILEAHARRTAEDDPVLTATVNELAVASVASVADRAGLSARQFERRFRQAVGIPPKLFSRMQRFQRVFPALEEDRRGWAEAALRCGYYDQAHLIRDFREFAGKPPSALLAENSDLARHFVRGREMSHFSNTVADLSR